MANASVVFNKLLLKKSETATAAESDAKCLIYMQSNWLADAVEFQLQETRANKCYRGQLTHEDFKEAAAEFEIPFEEFFEECRRALTTPQMAEPGFEYEIDEAANVLKLLKKQGLTMVLLEIQLKPLKNNYELLDASFEAIAECRKALAEKAKTDETHNENNREILEMFEKCLDEKANLEQQMLKKCALLLNKKKEKLVALQRQVRGGGSKKSDSSANEEEDDEEHERPTQRRASNTKSNANATTAKGTKRRATTAIESDSEDDDFSAATQPMSLAVSPSPIHEPAQETTTADDSNDSHNFSLVYED